MKYQAENSRLQRWLFSRMESPNYSAILISGKRLSGKTTFLKHMMALIHKKGHPVIVLDSKAPFRSKWTTEFLHTSNEAFVRFILETTWKGNKKIKEGLLLCLVEGHRYLNNKHEGNIFNLVYNESRHHGITVICESQKLQRLPGYTKTNADAVAVGFSRDKNDRQWLSDITDDFPDEKFTFNFCPEDEESFYIEVTPDGFKERLENG